MTKIPCVECHGVNEAHCSLCKGKGFACAVREADLGSTADLAPLTAAELDAVEAECRAHREATRRLLAMENGPIAEIAVAVAEWEATRPSGEFASHVLRLVAEVRRLREAEDKKQKGGPPTAESVVASQPIGYSLRIRMGHEITAEMVGFRLNPDLPVTLSALLQFEVEVARIVAEESIPLHDEIRRLRETGARETNASVAYRDEHVFHGHGEGPAR